MRIPSLALAFALLTGTAFAQMPPQPPPVNLNSGNEKERAACHPDVIKFCKKEIDANSEDVLGILSCLQRNRSSLSAACANVLKSHGQ